MKHLPAILILLVLATLPAAGQSPGDLLTLHSTPPESADFLRPISPKTVQISLTGIRQPVATFQNPQNSDLLVDLIGYQPSLTLLSTSVEMTTECSFTLPQTGSSNARGGKCSPASLSPGGKFVLSLKRTFYPLPLLSVAAGAALAQAIDSNPGYGQGARGYGRRFADRLGARTVKQFTGTFLVASIARQDPQYDPSPNGGFGSRFGHALKRVFVTRTDSGGEQFNAWTFAGNAAGASVSQAWLRRTDRGAESALVRFATGYAFDILVNLWQEFVICRSCDRK